MKVFKVNAQGGVDLVTTYEIGSDDYYKAVNNNNNRIVH